MTAETNTDASADASADSAPGRLAAAFAEVYGHEPAGVWAAPGRINLIGEHTDYNDGFALPLALPRRVLVAAGPREDGALLLRSGRRTDDPISTHLADLEPGAAGGWAAYPAGVAWALLTAGQDRADDEPCSWPGAADVGGAELLLASDLPAGSGLASSAALECAVATALDELWTLRLPRGRLARVAQRAENDFVGVPCGVMDQMAALRCEAGHALLVDCRDLSTTAVPLDLDAAGMRLLVIDTRAPHRHVDSEYAARRRACEEAAATLGAPALRDIDETELDTALGKLPDRLRPRVRHVVTENTRVLETVGMLRDGDFDGAGRLLTASHVSLRDDYEVSAPELDTAVDAALRAGALGARMTGGGFGGCAIALVHTDAVDTVRDAVGDAYRARDFAEPRLLTATPSAGAHRVA